MSAKVQPWDGASSASSKYRSKPSFDSEIDQQSTTKSPRSPRVPSASGRLSRQGSFGENRSTGVSRQNSSLSRQNSLQGASTKSPRRRGVTAIDDVDDILTDHSGATSARGPNSARSTRGRSRRSLGGKTGKKRVSFSVPLVDPRPEKTVENSALFGDYSLTEEEFATLQASDDSDSIVPRRMRKWRRGTSGRWRRWIPFGQYIPTLPKFAWSMLGFRGRDTYYS